MMSTFPWDTAPYVTSGLMFYLQIDLDDVFDPDEFSFNTAMKNIKTCVFPELKEDVLLQHKQNIPEEVRREMV